MQVIMMQYGALSWVWKVSQNQMINILSGHQFVQFL